ncbi:MAG: type II 3-dehydroquinate dehydratase [Oceanospirillaceae bacterium]|jgi:3-dehydroquinate dehydratase-2|nr:type II 3-dehydroquinate dehydratase [Oceanospirillaceae bacterium]MBT4441983.1 type II 3-dehydroquinate dehydratase [Oceanospirillaceae bacterium]MBT6077198.1 type II 3-dehydroquinate dehydratase [Oceanospirillaceae bacterium]MBT7330899.1 type II 3-dehydroquinate dehydratase [Oceanospirillaceae bacterium]
MAQILLLNGPNLNLLGQREPGIYGSLTLAQIESQCQQQCQQAQVSLNCLQSNAEHELIQAIHTAPAQAVEFIVINPAAFTHTSVAIRDALLGVNIPFIEVHLSNVHQRETFRHHSYLSDIAEGVICGLGADGYRFAIDAAIGRLSS